MSTTIQTRLKKAGRLLPVALLPFLSFAAQAQTLNYAVAGATNVAGTYTDLGTTGTAIATANTDDANSAAQPIGFTFNFNGTAFTQFVLNTNGFIRLGAAAPSGTVLYPSQVSATIVDPLNSSDPANTNLVMPFNQDLGPGTGTTGYRVATTGTAGSQVCTIQWANVSDKTDGTTDSQYANFSFQVKLYEGTNRIELVYNTATASTGTPLARFPNVGIKGSGVANGQTVLASKTPSSSAWSTASFITGAYTTFTLNYRANVGPDAGRTFRFAPTVLLAHDAAVTSLYTLGKVSANYSSPVTAQAVITNVGSTAQTNLPVTLTVSGATTYTNTQTVATLASGASTTVTFTYPVTATTGTNTVAVTIPTDDLATNNTSTATQAVTAADQSYIQGATYTGGVGLSAAGNILAVRYTTTAASSPIKTVTPVFIGAAATGVTSTYQVLIYSANAAGQPGTVLYTSPVQTRPTITGTTPTPAPVRIPGTVVSGTFFVALKTIGADNIGIGYQTESPLRAGTFFYTVDGTTWNDLNTQTISPRIGLDMAFGIASATKNDALAATVSLYPNPAHQRFELSVPAGSLRNASASLSNALGQVVQSRQLNLPAAGGIVPFDVSRLAAGVYSLTLKSGNDLVVKRVVVE